MGCHSCREFWQGSAVKAVVLSALQGCTGHAQEDPWDGSVRWEFYAGIP